MYDIKIENNRRVQSRKIENNLSNLQKIFLVILVAMLVAFPKAGIKTGNIPITFGYVLLALISFICVLTSMESDLYFRLNFRRAIALVLQTPIWGYTIAIVYFQHSPNLGFTISYCVGFILLPLMLLMMMGPVFERALDLNLLMRYLRNAIRFTVIYGIFLFFYRYSTGHWIEIPYLTVNADDVGTLDDKLVTRGDYAKLISTYNNGNIYGVCMLMLAPLYDRADKSIIFKTLFRVALVLTLSRTVWLGMLAYEGMAFLWLRRMTMKNFSALLIAVGILSTGVLFMLAQIGLTDSFLFDKNLGGRADQFARFSLHWIPTGEIAFPSEIIYLNLLFAFGVVGLVVFLLSTFSVVVLGWGRPRSLKRACAIGMLMLLLCGLSDGPILLIPVMAFYWGLASLSLTDHEFDDIETKTKPISRSKWYFSIPNT